MKGRTEARTHGRTGAAVRALTLCVCCVCASVRLSFAQCPDGTPPPCGTRPARVVATPASNSVAVLYFATRDTSDLYLAEGLTEDIATGLGRLAPRVEVKAPSSVRRAQRENTGNLRGIGRVLGVRYLVDGGLRRTPAGYRVSIRLVNTLNELTAWGETYDQSSAGLLDLPSTVAQAVAEAIAGTLAPAERTTVAARPTHDAQAWEHVLRGNFLIARRTQEDAQRAVGEYEEAIRLDSSYVDAFAALGSAYALAHDWSWNFAGLPQDSLLARAERASQRALALDSAFAPAWSAIAMTRLEQDRVKLAGVVPALRRAIALDPRRADPYHFLGVDLVVAGDDSGGTTALRQALTLDPERPITLTWLANAAFRRRHYADAITWVDSAIAVAPGFPYALGRRAEARALQGDTAGGLRDARDAVRASRGDSLLAIGALAWVEAIAGDTAQARLHARLVTGAAGSVLDEAMTSAAAAFAVLGDRDAALTALEQCRPRDAFLRFYLEFGSFDSLRSEPRFQRLVAELGGRLAPS